MVHYSSSRSPACFPAYLPTRRRQRRSGRQARGIPATFDLFVSSVYLPHARQRKASWDVDERIERRHFSTTFDKLRLADIRRQDVEIWLQGLREKRLAPSTCNRILAVLRSICSLALKYGAFPSGQSPCAGVSSFKVQPLRERCLTKEQAGRLMDELDRSDRQEAGVLKLLMLTGARKSEILKAQWAHIHLEQRLLTVPKSKSGRPRHIPLCDEAVAVIRSIPRVLGSSWLFPGHAPDRPLSDIYRFWDKMRRRLGLHDVRIHDLRHTFASLLVNSGHTLYEVQKLLGHSDPRTTMRYAHLGQSSLLAVVQTVSVCLGRTGRSENGSVHPARPHKVCFNGEQAGSYPCRA